MADSTSPLALLLLTALQAAKEAAANNLFNAGSPAMLYANNPDTTTGLTWGYIGGWFGGNQISNGTTVLTDNTTNYVVAARSNGAVTDATTTTNWDDVANYVKLYEVTTSGGVITAYDDRREAVGHITAGFASRTPNVQTVASASNVTPTFTNDIVTITALATNLTLDNPTGTAIPNLGMVIRIKDNGSSRTIAYDTQYRAIGITLPTVTAVSKTMYLAMIFNQTDTKWDVVAFGEEA